MTHVVARLHEKRTAGTPYATRPSRSTRRARLVQSLALCLCLAALAGCLEDGDTGPMGPAGPVGPQGPQGEPGPPGPGVFVTYAGDIRTSPQRVALDPLVLDNDALPLIVVYFRNCNSETWYLVGDPENSETSWTPSSDGQAIFLFDYGARYCEYRIILVTDEPEGTRAQNAGRAFSE